jgi:asparagine synthase (glutamine-hydrolysing)
VSRHLGTDHHELILPADVLDRVEDLAPCLDEPIADSAILPTFLLAQFARQNVKVVLTGEGADELFAGYGRYKAAYLSERLARMPRLARQLAAPLVRRMGRGPLFRGLPMTTLKQWAQALAESGDETLADVCRPGFLESAQRLEPMAWASLEEEPHSLNQALAFDLRTVLCDSLLMKVDKATMQASLEARVPYLDKRLVEFAVHLPAELKLRRFKGKYILRRLAARYLPERVVWRRKHGFVVPWEEWVRKPENPRIQEMLHGSRLLRSGVFEPSRLQEMRKRLVEGDRGTDAGLFFRIVILGLWLER